MKNTLNHASKTTTLPNPETQVRIQQLKLGVDWHADHFRVVRMADVQAVGSGEAALKYLANYLCQPPLREPQMEESDEPGVTFRYRNHGGAVQRATVSGMEFVRRVLQHVLPKGFQRVRHYGWRGAAARTKWERILALLDGKPPARVKPAPRPPPKCPGCGQTMFLIGTMPRAPTGWPGEVKV